jgi:hypothetical protein
MAAGFAQLVPATVALPPGTRIEIVRTLCLRAFEKVFSTPAPSLLSPPKGEMLKVRRHLYMQDVERLEVEDDN